MNMHVCLGIIGYLCLGVVIVHSEAKLENEASGHGYHVDQGLIEKLVRRVEGLEIQVEKQAETNRQQAETNRKLTEVNRKQADTNRKQAEFIEQLQLKLKTVEDKLETLKSSQAPTDDASGGQPIENDDIPASQTAKEQRHAKRALLGSEGVAFTAYVDHTLTHLGIDHTIVYNKVILNEGGAYNNNTGIFTCPYDGIYVFNFLVSSVHVNQIVAKLVVDNLNMVDGIADTVQQYHEVQGGNYVTLSLKAGQSVWVANYRAADMEDYSTAGYRFSTFSGHVLM